MFTNNPSHAATKRGKYTAMQQNAGQVWAVYINGKTKISSL
jgi:hypothetical protein